MNLGDSDNKNLGAEFFYLSLNFLSEAIEKILNDIYYKLNL